MEKGLPEKNERSQSASCGNSRVAKGQEISADLNSNMIRRQSRIRNTYPNATTRPPSSRIADVPHPGQSASSEVKLLPSTFLLSF